MKKTLAIALVLGVLSLGAVAYGHGGGPGWDGGPGSCAGSGWGGPGMMYGYGPGYGPMMGYGPRWGGGPGWNGPDVDYQSPEARKFFNATVELRKKLHDKMFEYREAYRSGDDKKAGALGKEIDELRDQLREKAKEAGFTGGWGARRGPGPRGGGYGPGACGGPGWGGGPYGR